MAEFDLNLIKRKVLRLYPAFGSILSSVKYEIVDNSSGFTTAGTNGKIIKINKDFMNTLTEDEQMFILAHEVCHIAFEHRERCKDKDKRLWNIATDAIINKNLEHDGLPILENAVNIEDALNYDADELYERLLKEQQDKQSNSFDKNGKGGNSNKDNNKNSDSQVGHDDHGMWNENSNEQNKQNDKQNQGSQSYDEKEIFKNNRKQVDKKSKEIMEQLKQHFGNSNSDEKLENVGNVGNAKSPLINWKKILRKELEMDSEKWGYKFSDKGNGYAPRLEDVEYEESAQTDIILDTSKSVSPELLRAFLRQMKTILPHSKIRVATFSTDFHNDWHEIKSEKDIDNLQLYVGGGTNFNAASKAFTKDPRVNKICFTDGDDFGDALIMNKRKDIIWISFGNPHFKPDHGKVIFVNPCELNRFLKTSKNSNKEEDLAL